MKNVSMEVVLLGIIILMGLGIGAVFFMKRDREEPAPVQQQQPVQQPIVQDLPEPEPEPPKPEYPIRSSYTGPWNTVRNLKLDGDMTCDVVQLGDEEWEGKFHGTWRGQSFSYDVKWGGPKNALKGTAIIDGADYTWTGEITDEHFNGNFDSRRYKGDFRLKRDR